MSRRGSILVVVAGIALLTGTLVLAFIVRNRNDVEESELVHRHIQARIMLAAACSYVQEASRLGWGEEAYGWVDVRDGQVGPKDCTGAALWAAGRWPAPGTHARCPMHAQVRPPDAVQPDAAPNRMVSDPADPLFGLPLLRRPDPLPVAATWAEFRAGDPTPRPESANRSWFRVHRDGPATFVVTVGAGASEGFKDWDEVLAEGAAWRFSDDQGLFETIRAQELRLWYRIEWSPAVASGSGAPGFTEEYDRLGWNSQLNRPILGCPHPNQGGTIQWIQRLRAPPLAW